MRASLKNHFHTGLEVGVEIIPTPPFLIPYVTPVVSYSAIDSVKSSQKHKPLSMKEHGHSIIGLPSVGVSTQVRIRDTMYSHGHSITSAGGSTGVGVSETILNPPPLSLPI